MKAIVREIQVKGTTIVGNLEEACVEFLNSWQNTRMKLNFTIVLPDGRVKSITIRDEGNETVAYGDFEGLPSAVDRALIILSPTGE
jgi:hypothetical protein